LKTHQDSLDWISGKGWKEGPFAKKAQYLKEIIGTVYAEERANLLPELMQKMSVLTDKTNSKRFALDKDFEPQYKACEKVGGDCLTKAIYRYCLAKKDLDNEYFSELANIAEDIEQLWYPKDVKYYNNLVFLTTLTAPNDHVLKAECATYTNSLLDEIRTYTLSECNPAGKPTCIEPPPAQDEDPGFPFFKDGECPIDVKIPFVVGKISLNCESFGFEAGEGITFRYEKNFKSRETTLAVGIGVSADIPGLDAGAGAEIGVKFDANNQPIDLIAGANAGVSLIGMNTPIISAGASVGINSSLTGSINMMGR